jgi:ankyrin repeat protein
MVLIILQIALWRPAIGFADEYFIRSLNSFLIDAVLAGDESAVRRLLKEGANVNANVRIAGYRFLRPLEAAAHKGHAEIVLLLLSEGAAVDPEGSPSLLHVATPQIVELLLEAGADVNASTIFGMTPLIGAVDNDYPDVVLALLNAGANAKMKDYDGETALDHVREGDKLIGTEAYEKLREATFE